MALTSDAAAPNFGPALSGKQIVYTEGGCGGGGGGCGGGGGGGAGGGACAFGGGGCAAGSRYRPFLRIKNTSTQRIVGLSKLYSRVLARDKGTADQDALTGSTFSRQEYNAVRENGVLAFLSEARWQQIQDEVQQIEAQLAQIANASDPPVYSSTCCDEPEVDGAFAAVVKQLDATRDMSMASMNVQLAEHGVALLFGGDNKAYYLKGTLAKYPPSAEQIEELKVASHTAMQEAGLILASSDKSDVGQLVPVTVTAPMPPVNETMERQV
jgi:hypothetical protein